MLRTNSLVTLWAVAAIGHKTRRLHFHHRNVRDVLLLLADRLQMPPALRTAVQFRFFRFMDLHHLRQFTTSKLALSALASRTSRLLHPVPPRERRRLTLPIRFSSSISPAAVPRSVAAVRSAFVVSE